MKHLTATHAYLMLVFTQLLWASALIVARGVHDALPPVAFSFWRWVAAVIIMAPIAIPLLRKNWSSLQTGLSPVWPVGQASKP